MTMKIQSLNGLWSLQKGGKGRKLSATVPGDVYNDLLNAGAIQDPFYRDNELNLQWIGEADWTYSHTFTVTEELLNHKQVRLECNGLDTFASVSINGHHVAKTDNMFRTYEWNVRELLKPGKNTVRIDFSSVLPYIQKKQAEFPGWNALPALTAYAGWVRKEQCNFGWDWGIKAVTCGIWRDIKLVAYDQARLNDIRIEQSHKAKQVGLKVQTEIEGVGKGLSIEVVVADGTDTVTSVSGSINRKRLSVDLEVRNPKLWWPNAMGEQHLYTVNVLLKNAHGTVIDEHKKRIGLRTLTLDRHQDQWGESFQFVVNGVPFFAKGANWIPVDAILARRTPEDYRRLVQAAAECNMNMLRVWGGGIYEDDYFYEVCDELGICVWQDFMFACSAYPIFLDDFMESVKAEARDAIKRLRHHPCMALWCGNNELEMMNVSDAGWEDGSMPWKDYKRLFDKLLPDQVSKLSPDIPYWPSSPHSTQGDRNNHRSHLSGDAHLWIMSGRYPLDCARGLEHRFASEFGFQSFPEPSTVRRFAEKDDFNISSRIIEHHQRAPYGNVTLMQQMLKCFRMPKGFESTLWLSQILQGMGIKGASEHFRRSMPRAMGSLYWQLNDCWPVASWASIDYHGRWKAAQYMARHFFSPVLISGVEDLENGTVAIHLTSDRLKRLNTRVSWTITDTAGTILDSGSKQTKTPVNGNAIAKVLKLKKLLSSHKPHGILVWLDADIDGEPSQSNLVFFAPPKHLDLSSTPGIRHKISKNSDSSFTIELHSSNVSLWTWLEFEEVDARLSDNFFHLRPGKNVRINVLPSETVSLAHLKESIIIRSLVNTY